MAMKMTIALVWERYEPSRPHSILAKLSSPVFFVIQFLYICIFSFNRGRRGRKGRVSMASQTTVNSSQQYKSSFSSIAVPYGRLSGFRFGGSLQDAHPRKGGVAGDLFLPSPCRNFLAATRIRTELSAPAACCVGCW